jgi:octaheme c-type cytochrome (tetrathionate reductase family)
VRRVAAARAWSVAAVVAAGGVHGASGGEPAGEIRGRPSPRSHLDHSAYFEAPFDAPQDVTRACLRCHPKAAREVMQTAHWQWLGAEVLVPGHEGPRRIGKKNLLNNFCISAAGNEVTCTKCHAGYGWLDDSFDFAKVENVDCLVCHERTGAYVKGDGGIPTAESDLLAAARSVGYPKRENCGVCHNYGGGGQGVKHGDLDSSLENPSPEDDVHMGGFGMLCIDCHRTERHRIPGRAFSVSVEGSGGVACTDCHVGPPHEDERLDAHLAAVACQACHIPTYARRLPTKTFWDWSRAGDPDRAEDPHRYLRIKGEFVYDQDVVPEYLWFDRSVERYLLGDRMDSTRVTELNRPRGGVDDPQARIWPFKIHRALQPFDRRNAVLLPPLTGGPGGYWATFDWNEALARGAEETGVAYSGSYGFARTAMYWPLSHMVAPKDEALACMDCHGDPGRLDWAALGYEGDPLLFGGRRAAARVGAGAFPAAGAPR